MSVIRRDTTLMGLSVAVVVFLAAFAALYPLANAEVVTLPAVQSANGIANPLMALIGTVLCFLIVRGFKPGESLRWVYLLMGVGLLLWTIAEGIYGVAQLQGVQLPTPSVADWVWVPGYLPLFAALFLRFRSLRLTPTPVQLVVVLSGFVILAVLSTIFVITPNVQQSTDPIGLALSIAYPVGDLLVALGVGLSVLVLLGGDLSRPWMLIAAGCLAIALSDSLYYYTQATSGYAYEALPVPIDVVVSDVAYIAGYTLIALGMAVQARIQKVL